MNDTTDMTRGNVPKLIRSMTLTLTLGAVASVVFGFVDTAFVGQLGESQLAALGYTAPVTLIGASIVLSLCLGVGIAVARASTDKEQTRRFTTDGAMIAVSIAVVIMVTGILTIKPLFYGMGATDDEMRYIIPYMTVWYIGLPAITFSMLGTNVMRGLGNAKVTAVISTVLYCIALALDPFLILGIGIFPKLGIFGAAISFFTGRLSVCLFMVYILVFKSKMFDFKGLSLTRLKDSAKSIFHVAVPNMLTKSIVPIGAYIVTAIISGYGSSAVAGFGAGSRIVNFILLGVNALAAVMIPFAGQNYSAEKPARMRRGFRYGLIANVFYGVGLYALLFVLAPYIARLFSSSDAVRAVIVEYMRIAMAGLVFQGGMLMITSIFNAVGKPLRAAGMWVVQVFVLYVPLSLLLSKSMGPSGIFAALAISYAISFSVSYFMLSRFQAQCEISLGHTYWGSFGRYFL